jgi:hypothetical protein
MILKIFSIYDEKAGAFLPPFFLPTVGMATRTFKDCCNSLDHAFGLNPADYTLFELGDFSDKTAHIQTLASPKSHGIGLIFVSTPENASTPDETEAAA